MALGERQGWRRNVWTLCLIVFVAFVGFQFFSPFLPLYVRELGVTEPGGIALWSGLLSAVTPAVSGFLSPLFGRLADRFGRKMMLIRSLAGFVVIIAAMGLVTSSSRRSGRARGGRESTGRARRECPSPRSCATPTSCGW
jgi:MFS transporter, DHA1 family, multidrug resistance protein